MNSSQMGLPSFDVTSYIPTHYMDDSSNTSYIGFPGYSLNDFFQNYGTNPDSTSLLGLPNNNPNQNFPQPMPMNPYMSTSLLSLPSYNVYDYMPQMMGSIGTSMMNFPGYSWGYGGVASSMCGFPGYANDSFSANTGSVSPYGNTGSVSPYGNAGSSINNFLGGTMGTSLFKSAGDLMKSVLGNAGSFGDGSTFNNLQNNMIAGNIFQSASQIMQKYMGGNFGIC